MRRASGAAVIGLAFAWCACTPNEKTAPARSTAKPAEEKPAFDDKREPTPAPPPMNDDAPTGVREAGTTGSGAGLDSPASSSKPSGSADKPAAK